MLPCLVFLALGLQPPAIARDDYGVPHIRAAGIAQAFYQAGYAVAQDRLWQMENSRRIARGQMAEVFGKKYAASDQEVLLNGYTDKELQQQVDSLSPKAHTALDAYVEGINAYIDFAEATHALPKGYAENGFQPRRWSALDSAAISVRLFQIFGRSSAGQIRNLALLEYLKSRPESKAKALDIMDDLLWQNVPSSPVTVKPTDDPIAKTHYQFPPLTRKITEDHLAKLPKVGLFELLPGVALAERATSKLVAQSVNVPYRTGSYCVVVSPKRSAAGYPLLMSGPQMGFTQPSIVHEMTIEAPGLHVTGMDVPGVPGVAIGYTPDVSWGLTTGVAFVEDIVTSKAVGVDGYEYGGKTLPLQRIECLLRVKGEPDRTVVQLRTRFGPVVIKSASGYYFSRHASTWMHELESLNALYSLYEARNADQVETAMESASMNFNFFYATRGGDIGYRYLGRIPARAPGLDPRFPVPGEPQFEWKGMIPQDRLPHVRNPKSGLIVNWNNKPATWWNNGDTPVWGEIFHSTEIEDALAKPRVSAQDLELAAWTIARREPTYKAFEPFTRYTGTPSTGGPMLSPGFTSLPLSTTFTGWSLDGSIPATIYGAWIDRLRTDLFEKTLGNLGSPDFFRTAVQPSVILRALEGKTKLNYLAGRKADDLCGQAYWHEAIPDLEKRFGADTDAWRYHPGSIRIDGAPPIPYSNRGTYIQIVELLSHREIAGRNVLPPGEADTGPHSQDQAPLSREWTYKPMATFLDETH